MEFLEIKHVIFKMKKLTGLVEEQIRYSRKKNSELEGIVIKTIQTKAQKEKDWGKNEQSLSDM